MNKPSRLLLGIAIPLLLTACGRWKDLAIADGVFTVKTPPGIALNCQQHANTTGFSVQGCTNDSLDTSYMVVADKFPTQIGVEQVDGALTAFLDFEAKRAQGEIVSSKDLDINGWKGKEFVLKNAQGEASGRVFIGQNYVVNAVAVAKSATASKENIQHFVASLQPVAK